MRNLRGVVNRIVASHTGSKPRHISSLPGGLSNHVFSVEHDEGEFVVRLNPEPEKAGTFEKERAVVEQVRKAGVPVPEILAVGDEPVPYCLLRKSPGAPATFHPQRSRILRDLGGYAARINSIRTHGFGENGLDWGRYLDEEFKLEQRVRTLRRHHMLPDQRLKKIRGVLFSACGKGRKPALNHGDLRLKNVLVDARGRITSILDWENATSNLAPEWELSLALHDLSVDEKEDFISGYGLAPGQMAAIAPAVKALNVVNYVADVERIAKSGDRKQLEFYRLRLNGALDFYSA